MAKMYKACVVGCSRMGAFIDNEIPLQEVCRRWPFDFVQQPRPGSVSALHLFTLTNSLLNEPPLHAVPHVPVHAWWHPWAPHPPMTAGA